MGQGKGSRVHRVRIEAEVVERFFILGRLHGWASYVVLTCLGLLPLAFASFIIDAPFSTSGADVVIWTGVIPVALMACGIGALCAEPALALFATAPSRAWAVHISRLTAGAVIATGAVAGLTDLQIATFISAFFCLAGLAVLSATLFGLMQVWVLPLFLLFSSIVFGAANRDTLHAWAWIVDPEPSPSGIATSSSLLVLAVASRMALLRYTHLVSRYG